MKKKSRYIRLVLAFSILAALIVLQGSTEGSCSDDKCLNEDLATEYGTVRIIDFTDQIIDGKARVLFVYFNNTDHPFHKRKSAIYNIGASGSGKTKVVQVLEGSTFFACWYNIKEDGVQKRVYICSHDINVPKGGSISVSVTNKK